MTRDSSGVPRGSGGSLFALADQVFELSSELGKLRQRSTANVDALRAAAQGVPELEEAFGPLYVALEAGLVQCHQADLAAVFGRPPAPSRGSLDSLPAVGNVCGVVGSGRGAGRGAGGGGTTAAVQHLARVISELEGNVKAAALLAEHGERFRTIARWAKRQSPTMSTTTAAATATQPAPASALSLSRPAHSARNGTARSGGSGIGSSPARRSDREEADETMLDPRDDWILKVFRGRAAAAAASSSSFGEGARPAPPLVVVNALRAPLPPVAAPPPPPTPPPGSAAVFPPSAAATNGRGEREAPPRESRASSAAAGRGGGAEGASWLNPLSWFSSRSVPRPADPPPGAPPPPLPPPPRPSLPPRVVVRVVYAAPAPDMAERLAMAAERRDGEVVRGRTASSVGNDAASDGGGGGGGGGSGEDRASGGRVVLLRSEVRVLQGGSGHAARMRGAAPDGSLHVMQMQLQVVLQLQTPTPVVVSRLLHGGGSVRESARRVAGPARDGEEEDKDVIPAGWGQAPAELYPPGGSAEGECQLKVGTNHLLGMNIVLPSSTAAGKQPAGRNPRARPRRASDLPPRPPAVPPPPRRSSPYEAPPTTPPAAAPPPLSTPPLPRGGESGLGNGAGIGGGISDAADDDDDGDNGEAVGRGGRARPVAGHHPLRPVQRQEGTDPVNAEPAERSNSGKKRPRSEPGGGAGAGGEMGTPRAASRLADSRPLGGGAGGSVTAVRDAAACGVQAFDGSSGGNRGIQDENNSRGGAAREPKRRRRAGWGLGFLRLWGRADTPDGNDHAVAAAAAAAASTPAEASSGSQTQPGGEEPGLRGGGPAEGSDREHHQRDVRHDAAAVAAAAGYREGELSTSPPLPPGPGGRGDRTGACRGEACTGGTGDAPSEVPAAAPLRRSPLIITVVLAPPPASHGLENGG